MVAAKTDRGGRRRKAVCLGPLLAICWIGSLPLCLASSGEPLRVAVASNFYITLEQVVERYGDERPEPPIALAQGSTGKLFAQIVAGAPFDAFFAADQLRIERLEERGLLVPGTRLTYAKGRLALVADAWVTGQGEDGPVDWRRVDSIALANPKLAPYGVAAESYLAQLGEGVAGGTRKVWGDNVAQAFHFFATGSVDLALVSYAQCLSSRERLASLGASVVLPPESQYEPILQDAALLSDTPLARRFWSFLASEEAREIIRKNGYALP